MAKLTKNQRCYLHRKLKGIYKVEVKKRTVYVPFLDIVSDSVKQRSVLDRLCGGGYNIQSFID